MSGLLSPILRIVAAVVTLVLAQSAFWSPGSSAGLVALLLALFGLSAWRPAWGLLALAALAPFGRLIVTGALSGFPIRGTESLVLAWLAGVAVGWRRQTGQRLPESQVTAPWVLFAAVTVASAAVLHLGTQAYHDWPGVFLGRLGEFLVYGFQDLPGDPRPWMEPVSFGYASTAAAVVEGVTIVLLTAGLCRRHPHMSYRLLAVSVTAAAVAGGLSLLPVFAEARATGNPLAALPSLIAENRWAFHVNKVNTAASYFVLLGLPAVAMAVVDRRRRALWILACALIGTGLTLTQSLAGIVGAATVGATVLGWLAYRASADRPVLRRTALLLLAVVLALAAVRVGTRDRAYRSLTLRWAVTFVSLETAAEAPLFGVGIGTYPVRSVPHITPFVREGFGEGSMQAHNHLLQVATELGVVGLGCFLWALAGIVAGTRAGPEGPTRWDRVSALGVAAFLISALSGQPMVVDTVAIPAFLMMGIASAAPGLKATGRYPWWLGAGLLVLILSVPIRAWLEINLIDPRRAGYGTTFDEEPGPDRRLVHWLDGRSRLFADRRSRFIRVEARATRGDRPNELFLELSADGLRFEPFGLRPDASLTACAEVDEAALRRGPGRRPLDVRVTTAEGVPAPPGSAWALVTGSDRPCR